MGTTELPPFYRWLQRHSVAVVTVGLLIPVAAVVLSSKPWSWNWIEAAILGPLYGLVLLLMLSVVRLYRTLLRTQERAVSMFGGQDPSTCPRGPHRGPEGPNEDVAQCPLCWSLSWGLRPDGETYGDHLSDCSLPRRHEGRCAPGGAGHQPAPVIRGYWPEGR